MAQSKTVITMICSHSCFHISVLHSHFPQFEVSDCIFSLFCLQQTSSGEERLRMCVAVKKKLQLYYWKDREFHELQVKLNMFEM